MKDPEKLDKKEEKILKRIEDWMNHDIEAMISGGCNVSCATLLSIFMEVLGGIANGTLNDDDPQKSKARFLDFLRLPWVPRGYISLNDKLARESEGDESLYNRFRCALVHSYFFGGLDIFNDPDKPTSRCCPDDISGIQEASDGSGRLIIHVNDLAYDIKKARNHLFKEIRETGNGYRKNFRKVLANI